MDLNDAFNSDINEVVGNTFICANNNCKKHNVLTVNIIENNTYKCKYCSSDQYRGGNRMFLGIDPFNLEIDSDAQMAEFDINLV